MLDPSESEQAGFAALEVAVHTLDIHPAWVLGAFVAHLCTAAVGMAVEIAHVAWVWEAFLFLPVAELLEPVDHENKWNSFAEEVPVHENRRQQVAQLTFFVAPLTDFE